MQPMMLWLDQAGNGRYCCCQQELELEEAELSVDVEALKSELTQLQQSKTTLDSKLKLLESVMH